MKPFNLQEALAGKPVVTGDGRKVTDLHYFKDANLPFKIYACVDGNVLSYHADGKYTNISRDKDNLFMQEPIVEKYVNVYQHSITGDLCVGEAWPTYEKAINVQVNEHHYIKTIKIDNRP